MKSPLFHPGLSHALSAHGVTPRHVTEFDSAAVFHEALAAFLHGEDHAPGARTRLGRALGKAALCALPPAGLTLAYQLAARVEAVPFGSLQSFRSESIARWITSGYPRRRYPVVFLGASNGAAVQLAAAVGAPWLPQNHLVLVRQKGLDPQDPARSLELGRRAARALMAHAPELRLHQVQDPVRDRLLGQEAIQFRLKRLTLGIAYERFLLQHLEPGGTLVLVDCRASWPCLEVAERHFFQFGGVGGVEPSERYDGGKKDLSSQPEAEWGYAPQLTADALRFADRHGYRVERLSFDHPEDLSPWVANFYRNHLVHGSGAPDRLLIESFCLLDPSCVRRTASVPFWTLGNQRASTEAVGRYLDATRGFDDIRAVLFSNGVRSPSTASLEDWLSLLRRARERHGLLGVSTNDYPADFGVYLRYHEALLDLPDAPQRPPDHSWSDVRAYAEHQDATSTVRLERICD